MVDLSKDRQDRTRTLTNCLTSLRSEPSSKRPRLLCGARRRTRQVDLIPPVQRLLSPRAKPNMYQSLHTSLIDPRPNVSNQLRTDEMHCVAEEGIAAHWNKEGKSGGSDPDDKSSPGSAADGMAKTLADPTEFIETVKVDLFIRRSVCIYSKRRCQRTADGEPRRLIRI